MLHVYVFNILITFENFVSVDVSFCFLGNGITCKRYNCITIMYLLNKIVFDFILCYFFSVLIHFHIISVSYIGVHQVVSNFICNLLN
jgi:hypothetical protein